MTDDDLDLRLRGWFRDDPIGLSANALARVTADIATRPQHRPRPTWWPWVDRPPTLGAQRGPAAFRWLTIAATAVIVLAVGLQLLPDQDAAVPTMSPDPSASPSATVVPQDAALLDGGWTTLDAAPGLPSGRWELSLGDWAIVSMPSLDGDGIQSYALWLRPVTVVGNEVRIGAPEGGACALMAATYTWVIDPGDVLRLTPISEPCAERQAGLAGRSWMRRWTGPMVAERSYRTDSQPSVVLTIPAGMTNLEGFADPASLTHNVIDLGTSRLVSTSIVQETYVDPCDIRLSTQPFEGDAAALADWFESVPQIQVTDRASAIVDGRPAVRLRIAVEPAAVAACHLGMVGYWTDPLGGNLDIGAGGSRNGHLSIGDTTDEMLIVDVGDEVVVIVAQGPSATFDDWLTRVGPMLAAARIVD